MATNFNIGKFNPGKNAVNKAKLISSPEPKKTPPTSNEELRKKIIKLGGIILIGVLLLLLILFILSFFNHKNYTYSEIENIMKNAAVRYYQTKKGSLPSEENQVSEVEVSTLVENKYMKEFSKYVGDNVQCSGSVKVRKKGNDYQYSSYLDCGEDYTSKELYKVLIDSKNIVMDGYGLYNIGGSYVYRGENPSNYLKLDGRMWRIVKITPDNKVELILNEVGTDKTSWDNRYNKDVNYRSGINEYPASRIREYLDTLYKLDDANNLILTKSDRTKLASVNLCTGKRQAESDGKENVEECTSTLTNQKIGLLTVSDYMMASVDNSCITPVDKNCQNYNYLSLKETYLLLTANSKNTSEVYFVNESGYIESQNALTYGSIRPVVYLDDNIMYKSGNGTLEKPYKVK